MSTNGPVMDGANDDMSDNGTPKNEASDLMDDGRTDEVNPPDTHGTDEGLVTDGLEEDPLHNSR